VQRTSSSTAGSACVVGHMMKTITDAVVSIPLNKACSQISSFAGELFVNDAVSLSWDVFQNRLFVPSI